MCHFSRHFSATKNVTMFLDAHPFCYTTFISCWSFVYLLSFLGFLYFRLDETTYTIDEVKDMLNNLLISVQGELEAELINSAHTNVLLLRQMFMQAEKWHLKLSADISELENRFVWLLEV